jgi:hypothetical protein
MKKEPNKEPNTLYALHFKDELIEPNIWKKYSDKYGSQGLYGWKPPKKVYYTLGHAKAAMKHLPKQIINEVQIIKYKPFETAAINDKS